MNNHRPSPSPRDPMIRLPRRAVVLRRQELPDSGSIHAGKEPDRT